VGKIFPAFAVGLYADGVNILGSRMHALLVPEDGLFRMIVSGLFGKFVPHDALDDNPGRQPNTNFRQTLFIMQGILKFVATNILKESLILGKYRFKGWKVTLKIDSTI
jgi:hypothetical protein